MRPLVLALALAALFPVLAPGRARACSCLERSFEELAADAHAIFEGRVVAVEPIDAMHVRVRLAVVQTWREANREQVEVRTASSSAACGVDFEVGRSYLVLAGSEGGALTASLCGGTRAMEDAGEARMALGSGVIPVDVADEETPESSAESSAGERERRVTVAPRRGGCAGCGVVTSGGEMAGVAALFGLVAAIATRRRRIR